MRRRQAMWGSETCSWQGGLLFFIVLGFSQNLCVSSYDTSYVSPSYPLLPYTHAPPLSWGGLSWFLFPDQAAVTPLWLWDAFIFTQGSGDGGDPSLQHPFCSDLDLPHQLSPLVISSKQFHSFPKSLFWNSPSVPEV